MEFTVLEVGQKPPAGVQGRAYLVTDLWDDWFKYATMYTLIVVDDMGESHTAGSVKIGARGMTERRPPLPPQFNQLTDAFFSLGQDSSYYGTLKKLPAHTRVAVLTGLRDMAFDPTIYEDAKNEDVMDVSLLRSVPLATFKQQFHRMAHGGEELTEYDFTYQGPMRDNDEAGRTRLAFQVKPDSHPPTNIHVLIGRNGVGKTRLLSMMTRSLAEEDVDKATTGAFILQGGGPADELFSNLVSVSFSAFDPFLPIPEQRESSAQLRYAYVGLKRPAEADGTASLPKTPEQLNEEFARSIGACLSGARKARWHRALETLEGDPIFKDAEVGELASREGLSVAQFYAEALALFASLSSGHKIVLLTVTRLVETVEEKTLVLLDEPEAHLHPPLLAAFVRALSDLLIDRNGVAIIATHSPVVLQEVPKDCVWKLRRSGHVVRVERPDTETFGENVGLLTREVFGLEVTHSGFHKMISDAVAEGRTYEELLQRFDGKLGGEARAIARALIAVRDAPQGAQ